ncbi:HK97-gp10 family putative phage morphogenesis protein [Xanthobacter autotrophicus DSM 597]|uniref:HK97-gp10 family putative phage morphogenesis protein n=1 Tax=Xanthobacter wiegelii TaxID=3119913 RepID=UPI00372A8BE1
MAIKGLASLRRKLRAIPDAAREEIRRAMEEAAQEVVNLARHLAPVDAGDLRDSIGWTWGDPPRGAIVLAKSRPRKGAKDMRLTIYAGNDKAFYARWVEFGTAAHPNKGKFTGTRHPGTRAQPFFFPAYRAERKKMKSKVSRAITKAAKKVAAS